MSMKSCHRAEGETVAALWQAMLAQAAAAGSAAVEQGGRDLCNPGSRRMQAAWLKGCFSSALPGCTSIWADIIIQPQKDQQLLKQLQIFAKISNIAHL